MSADDIAALRLNAPQAVERLDAVLATFQVNDLSALEAEIASKVDIGAPSKNSIVCEKVATVRQELSQATMMLQNLSRWISMLVPLIEDGNNFGVAVQGEVLKSVRERGHQLNGYFQALPGYHKDRAAAWKELNSAAGVRETATVTKEETDGDSPPKKTKISESKVVDGRTEMHHSDGVAHIVALDVQTYFHLYYVLTKTRDTYQIVFDMIEKNIAKIEAPKGTGGSSHGGMSLY